MTNEEKRRTCIDIINTYADTLRDLQDIVDDYPEVTSTQAFRNWVNRFDLKKHWEWAKLKRKKRLQDEDPAMKSGEEAPAPSTKTPMLVKKDGLMVPLIHPEAPDRERVVRALELYIDSDLPLVECIDMVDLPRVRFFRMTIEDKELSALESDAQELRALITKKRLSIDKRDALDITTRKIFDRVLKGSKSEQDWQEVTEEQMLDAEGNVIGSKRKVRSRQGKEDQEASVSELRLAIQLLKVGDTEVEVPEAALEATDVEFNPDDLPDISMMDYLNDEE